MTSLFFDIFGRDQGASQAFDDVGRAADNAGTRLAALNTKMAAAARAEQEATQAMEQAAQRETAARAQSEQAATRLRDAEQQLDTVRRSIAPTADNIAAAEQRVSQARRDAVTAEHELASAEQNTLSAAERLTTAHNNASNAARQHASALKEVENGMRGAGNETDNFVAKLGKLDLGSTMFAAIGASIQPLLASIGQLSGALGVLPAAAMAVGTAFGTVAIGVQGMSTALKDGQKAADAATAATKADATAQQATTAARQAATGAIGGNAAALARAQQAQQTATQATAAAKTAHDQAKQAADAYAQSLTNLAPAAQKVVSELLQLKPAYDETRKAVQEHLFAGIANDLRDLGQTVLPVVKTGLTQMADALNSAIKQVVEFVQQKTSISDYKQIFADVAGAVKNFAEAIKPILQIFTDVAAVGAPILKQLGDHFATAAQHAAEFVSNARQTGQLAQWIQTGLQAVRDLWDAFKNVVAIIKDLATQPGFGPNFLQALRDVTGFIRWIIENVPGATTLIQAFFDAWVFAKIVSGIAGMITKITEGIGILAKFGTANMEAAAAAEVAAGRVKAAWAAAGLAMAVVVADQVLPQNTPEQSKQGQEKPYTPSGFGANARDELHGLAEGLQDPKKALEDLIQEVKAFPGQVANSPLVNFFKQLPTQIAGALGQLKVTIQQNAKSVWDGFVQGLESNWNTVVTFFKSIPQKISTAVGDAKNWIVQKAQDMWDGFKARLDSAWNTVVTFFKSIPQKISTAIGDAKNWIVQKAQDLWDGFKARLDSAWNTVSAWFKDLPNKITTAVGDAKQWIVQKAQDMWDGFLQKVEDAWTTVENWFKDLPNKIKTALGDAKQWLVQVGSDIVQGIWQGIQQGWAWLTQQVQQLAQQLLASAKAALGIASPSKEFHAIGEQITQGLQAGINQRKDAVVAAVKELVGQLTSVSWDQVNAQSTNGASGSSGRSGAHRRRHGGWDDDWDDWGDWWRGRGGAPLPQQLMMTAGRSNIANFGVGSSIALSGSALPILPNVLSTTYNPGTRSVADPSAPGRGGSIHISSNSALINELLRMIRSEVRKQGGNVQNVLGY